MFKGFSSGHTKDTPEESHCVLIMTVMFPNRGRLNCAVLQFRHIDTHIDLSVLAILRYNILYSHVFHMMCAHDELISNVFYFIYFFIN